MPNAVTRTIDHMPPQERALAFVGAMLALGWLFYGRDGSAQAFLPFPQGSLSPDYRPVR